jgi:hypothetical protein
VQTLASSRSRVTHGTLQLTTGEGWKHQKNPTQNDNSGERHRVDLSFRKQESKHFVASVGFYFLFAGGEREAVKAIGKEEGIFDWSAEALLLAGYRRIDKEYRYDVCPNPRQRLEVLLHNNNNNENEANDDEGRRVAIVVIGRIDQCL